MLYPLYEYYAMREMSLEEIAHDYVQRFYLRHYGSDKVEKVTNKLIDSNRVKELYTLSIKQNVAPNYIDFGSVINSIPWFIIQSCSTQALGVLLIASRWNQTINKKYCFIDERSLKNDTIKFFKKFDMVEEMTKEQFENC